MRNILTAQFKLIKTYPGSPTIGTIWDWQDKYDIGDYPEYWEEVGPEYEIISIVNPFGIYTKRANGRFTYIRTNGHGMWQMNELKDSKINSVKRLSDGHVFTVGDRINYNANTIALITVGILTNKILVTIVGDGGKCVFSLNKIRHSEAIFTTEDGVKIYSQDAYSVVNTNLWRMYTDYAKYGHGHMSPKWFKYFSTESKAKEYIAKNKPIFTTADGVNIHVGDYYNHVNLSNWEIHECGTLGACAASGKLSENEFKYFSTLEAANQYVSECKPKPILTTEDGIEMFVGDSYYWVDPIEDEYSPIGNTLTVNTILDKSKTLKRFSTRQLATDYVVTFRRKPLITTEDGVDIYSGDGYYWIEIDPKYPMHDPMHCKTFKGFVFCKSDTMKRFSTLEAAEQYIANLRKPIFTTIDGADIFLGDSYYAVYDANYYQNKYRWKCFCWIADDVTENHLDNKSIHRFSNKKDAEAYLEFNKPKFSIADFNNFVNETYNDSFSNGIINDFQNYINKK